MCIRDSLFSTSGNILSASVIARPQSGKAGQAKACLCILLMFSKFSYPIFDRDFWISPLFLLAILQSKTSWLGVSLKSKLYFLTIFVMVFFFSPDNLPDNNGKPTKWEVLFCLCQPR